jgi:hypothetical protein
VVLQVLNLHQAYYGILIGAVGMSSSSVKKDHQVVKAGVEVIGVTDLGYQLKAGRIYGYPLWSGQKYRR